MQKAHEPGEARPVIPGREWAKAWAVLGGAFAVIVGALLVLVAPMLACGCTKGP